MSGFAAVVESAVMDLLWILVCCFILGVVLLYLTECYT